MNRENPRSSSHGRIDRSNAVMLSAATPPVSLVIVGVLFCLRGLAALLTTAVALVQGHVNVDLTFLCLFVGVGLLRRSIGCRTWALVFLWIGLILTPLAVLVTLSLPGLARFGPLWPIGLLQEMLLIWMLWVLKRADVRRHFEIASHAPPVIASAHGRFLGSGHGLGDHPSPAGRRSHGRGHRRGCRAATASGSPGRARGGRAVGT